MDPDNECSSPASAVCNGVGNGPACACGDGIMNFGETAIDCGGPNCTAC